MSQMTEHALIKEIITEKKGIIEERTIKEGIVKDKIFFKINF